MTLTNQTVINSLLELDNDNENSFVVASSSMVPALKPGNKITIEKTDHRKITVGQVVVFKDHSGRLVAHRVIEKSGFILVTAGDSNRKYDRPIHVFDVLGIIKETAIQAPLSKLDRLIRSVKRKFAICCN